MKNWSWSIGIKTSDIIYYILEYTKSIICLHYVIVIKNIHHFNYIIKYIFLLNRCTVINLYENKLKLLNFFKFLNMFEKFLFLIIVKLPTSELSILRTEVSVSSSTVNNYRHTCCEGCSVQRQWPHVSTSSTQSYNSIRRI